MNTSSRAAWLRQSRRHRISRLLGRLSVVPTAMLAMMGGALGVLALQQTDIGRWLAIERLPVIESGAAPMVRSFAPCGSVRVTCVVDGDTFWLDGTRIRIADINTPEISAPHCAAEAQLGRRATERLTQLLNAGPFTLAAADRDEDRYGRKLRIVERDGQSIGMALVAEGLAHEWAGQREGWC